MIRRIRPRWLPEAFVEMKVVYTLFRHTIEMILFDVLSFCYQIS
jgi:hypothetical protein